MFEFFRSMEPDFHPIVTHQASGDPDVEDISM